MIRTVIFTLFHSLRRDNTLQNSSCPCHIVSLRFLDVWTLYWSSWEVLSFVSVSHVCVFFMQMPAPRCCHSEGWGQNTYIVTHSARSVHLFVTPHSFSVVGFCTHWRCLVKKHSGSAFPPWYTLLKINFRSACARIRAPNTCSQPSQGRALEVFSQSPKSDSVLDKTLPDRVKPAPHPRCARACRWFNAAFVFSADLPFPWLLTVAHQAKLGLALVGFCC